MTKDGTSTLSGFVTAQFLRAFAGSFFTVDGPSLEYFQDFFCDTLS
jgi:hypothetical protein